MELISREEVMRLAESGKLLSGSFGERAKDIINSLPTIDERKEGHWVSHGDDQCSECGMIFPDLYPLYSSASYCPNCGSRMRVESQIK